ncbi:penicillin-binding transpeptidase domain-containing protein [Salinicoccus halitifaciens]|uniref:Penicillin-binding protein 2 prime/penicillin-binding protein n=1 Tax=Salinicoccus halitifaciens TaxID=1073415 RepID=A0ABV2E8U2_9STAP|nr:penicillin-binding transpeptidase domain-containing protein [Salinicoccus halitifaciens]MCD2137931.1 penicillin-binding transpeptidase domain-containing protein [Salinicoccus halitifaciens]
MKKWIGIIIGGIVLLAAAAFLLINYTNIFQAGEEAALDDYVSQYEAGNYEEIYESLHIDRQERYGPEEVTERYEKLYEDLGVESRSIDNLELNEEESTEQNKLYEGDWTVETAYGELTRDIVISLLYDEAENAWHVEWTPDMIIPGLNGNRTLDFNFTSGVRGEIQDQSGEPLAFNGRKEVVGFTAGEMTEEELTDLADVLEVSEASLENTFNQEWIGEGMFVPVKEAHRFSDKEKSEFSYEGLQVQEQPSREYPLDEAAFHLIGYVGAASAEEIEASDYLAAGDVTGKRGLESLYDERLQPSGGYEITIADVNGDAVDTLFSEEAEDGSDVVLTIDGDLQEIIHGELEEDSGASVALAPDNGDILAAASYPAPSPYDFMFGITQEELDALEEDEENPLLGKFNRATSPGSTQKILSALVALNTEGFDRDATRTITGSSWQADESWGGYTVNRYHVEDGEFDLARAITSSDNIYFAQTMLDLGADRFVEGMEALGIGEEYDSDYPIYTSQVSNDGTIESEILLADSAYGQGELLISPLQITAIYSGVVNGGDVYVPRILADSEAEIQVEGIAEADDLAYLEDAMRSVVTDYHADDMERDYASFAGKTGTSENKMSQDTRGSETGWFIGYDQDEKDMMLALYVEDVEDRGMSEYSAQKFADIHDAYRDLE